MATIVDISKRTGLSIATISKYLNGGKLRERNRVAIEEAIEELGYETNELARGLKTNKSLSVGILLPEISDVFGTQIISAIQRRMQEDGYSCMICMFGQSPESLERQLAFMRRKKADGVIIMPNGDRDACIKEASERGVPVVLFDRLVKGVDCDAVVIDNRRAARQATELLIKNGHTRIGFLCGYDDNYTARERLAGYMDALAAAGIAADAGLVLRNELTVEVCRRMARRLLESAERPTAMVASNYYSAQGMIVALNECGLDVPGDISAVVFDDLQCMRMVRPPLTAVAQPVEEIGLRAAELLLARLAGQSGPPRVVTLPAELIVRQSVSEA